MESPEEIENILNNLPAVPAGKADYKQMYEQASKDLADFKNMYVSIEDNNKFIKEQAATEKARHEQVYKDRDSLRMQLNNALAENKDLVRKNADHVRQHDRMLEMQRTANAKHDAVVEVLKELITDAMHTRYEG